MSVRIIPYCQSNADLSETRTFITLFHTTYSLLPYSRTRIEGIDGKANNATTSFRTLEPERTKIINGSLYQAITITNQHSNLHFSHYTEAHSTTRLRMSFSPSIFIGFANTQSAPLSMKCRTSFSNTFPVTPAMYPL